MSPVFHVRQRYSRRRLFTPKAIHAEGNSRAVRRNSFLHHKRHYLYNTF
jgi:hypothetical protein